MTSEWIRKMRDDRGLTRPVLGSMIGATVGQIAHWETSSTVPSEHFQQELKRIEQEVDPLKEFTAEEIKELRSFLGFSQQELSLFLDVSTNTVRAWEKGKKTPWLDMWQCQWIKNAKEEERKRITESKMMFKELLWLTNNSIHGSWERNPDHVKKVRNLGRQLYG